MVRDEDTGLAALLKMAGRGDIEVEVGILDSAGAAEVAAYQEFGTADIPARPFIAPTFDENEGAYVDALARGFDNVVEGGSTPERELLKIGARVAGDIKRKITDVSSPPNAPSTVKKKGSSNPLIDTGTMRNAVGFAPKK